MDHNVIKLKWETALSTGGQQSHNKVHGSLVVQAVVCTLSELESFFMHAPMQHSVSLDPSTLACYSYCSMKTWPQSLHNSMHMHYNYLANSPYPSNSILMLRT